MNKRTSLSLAAIAITSSLTLGLSYAQTSGGAGDRGSDSSTTTPAGTQPSGTTDPSSSSTSGTSNATSSDTSSMPSSTTTDSSSTTTTTTDSSSTDSGNLSARADRN